VNVPLPGMIRHFRPHLDQATDQPFNRAPDVFAAKVKLPNQVKKVVGQNPHLQTGMVSVVAVLITGGDLINSL
jgi:hypothetical protein